MQRADKLTYNGAKMNPRRRYMFAPARDLGAKDIARLTDEQYEALVTAPDGVQPVYTAGETEEEREMRLAAQREKRAEKKRRKDSGESADDDESSGDVPDADSSGEAPASTEQE